MNAGPRQTQFSVPLLQPGTGVPAYDLLIRMAQVDLEVSTTAAAVGLAIPLVFPVTETSDVAQPESLDLFPPAAA